jgi:amino acid permease
VFTGFIFFGGQIINFLYKIPALIEIKEYLNLTKDSLESFTIFLILIMLPITIIVFLISARFNRGTKSKTKKAITVPKSRRNEVLKNANPKPLLKVNKEKKKSSSPSIKKSKDNTPKEKLIKTETKQNKIRAIGLTGLQIK